MEETAIEWGRREEIEFIFPLYLIRFGGNQNRNQEGTTPSLKFFNRNSKDQSSACGGPMTMRCFSNSLLNLFQYFITIA
jgi:hypothetical protein